MYLPGAFFYLQLPQSDLDGIYPNFKRFRIENGDSLAEKDEVRKTTIGLKYNSNTQIVPTTCKNCGN